MTENLRVNKSRLCSNRNHNRNKPQQTVNNNVNSMQSLTPLGHWLASPSVSVAVAGAAVCASFSDFVSTDNMTGLLLPVSSFTCMTSQSINHSFNHSIKLSINQAKTPLQHILRGTGYDYWVCMLRNLHHKNVLTPQYFSPRGPRPHDHRRA